MLGTRRPMHPFSEHRCGPRTPGGTPTRTCVALTTHDRHTVERRHRHPRGTAARQMPTRCRRGPTQALTLVIAIACGGCSFVFLRSPRLTPAQSTGESRTPAAEVECTSSRLAPIADTVGAVVLLAVSALAALCPGDPDYEGGAPRPTCNAHLTAAIAGTVAYTASSAYGFVTASGCEDAKEEAARSVSQRISASVAQPSQRDRERSHGASEAGNAAVETSM